MAESSPKNGRRRFSDKWGKHELDVLAVLSSAFPQWLTSRQIAQRVKAYADSYGELADQAAKAAFAKQFQRDRAKLAYMGIAIESRQPEYSSKSEGQDFASYRLLLGDEPRIRLHFEQEDMPVLAAANYLAQSMSVSTTLNQQVSNTRPSSKVSRSNSRVPQVPVPGVGLDPIAPGLGTQVIPQNLVDVIASRRYAATVEVDGELLNVAYIDSDDLAMFVLEHPSASIREPKEAVEAFNRRLEAAMNFELADDTSRQNPVPVSSRTIPPAIDDEDETESALIKRPVSSPQTGSEVDRRLKLMLFLSAHIGEEYTLEELAERFIGRSHNSNEQVQAIMTIRKDIDTLTTVSDDGEVAGSQFFDIDWSLLENERVVSATNSLGLERLAGISPQYLSLLTAATSYLAHSPLLPEDLRIQASSLYTRLRKHGTPGTIPWLSLTGYELEPSSYAIVKTAIDTHALLRIEYTDGAGRTRSRIVAPSKIFVEEGLYYVAAWNGIDDYIPEDIAEKFHAEHSSNPSRVPKWMVLRLARINKATLIEPTGDLLIPEVPSSELTQWNFDNGTPTVIITDKPNLPFIAKLPGATVEPWGDGEKIHLMVSSDSWFVAFCIAHARHITAIGPETLQTVVKARARRELSISDGGGAE